MKKYVEVIIETPYDEFTDYVELPPDADEEVAADMAATSFHNRCNYGYSIVNEDQVPEDER